MSMEAFTSGSGPRGFLDGQMLIATPAMGNSRFARSVIYMCVHSGEGAMGIVVNHRASRIKLPELLVQPRGHRTRGGDKAAEAGRRNAGAARRPGELAARLRASFE